MGVAYSGNHKGGKKCVDNEGGFGGGGGKNPKVVFKNIKMQRKNTFF